MSEAITVALTDVSVRLGGVDALSGFSGSFAPGTVSAVIGGDGAGKTSLLRVLAGRLPATTGEIAGLPPDRRRLGYQPARSGVWQNLSVAENVAFVARSYGVEATAARARSAALLERAGLADATDRVVARLSGGMRQKLGVVLATLHQPGLVLLDEPTTGVDPSSRAELWTLIAATAAEGSTVVFATTYLDEAERATSLFLLDRGRLLASGAPDEVIAATPGRLWQAPVARSSARAALASERAWRRGNTVYLWDPAPTPVAPPGFRAAPGDMENTSIAFVASAAQQTDGLGGAPSHLSTPVRADRTPRLSPQRDARITAHPSQHLLDAQAVERNFGEVAALNGVALHLERGEVVGLLGGNGAGKTTLMRILLGLDHPSAGTATLFGKSPSRALRRRIGYVAQGLGLYASLSALENLEFAADVQGVRVPDAEREFARSFGRGAVSELPLGTQRSLAYLAATGHDPELLILDEPTSGMDALARARLWRTLREFADRGTGILVTTHYMQEAAQCDRLVILTAGRVSASGTMDDITRDHTSLTVETAEWNRAFSLLRVAGLPVLLDGRTLRVPGTPESDVAAALAPIAAPPTIRSGRATLGEAMLLSERASAGS